MIAIQLSNVSLVLGARRIFENLSWEIQHDQKIGLIGPNGAGKSSLFKLILGEYTPEAGGTVTRARSVTIGCLPQSVLASSSSVGRGGQIQSPPDPETGSGLMNPSLTAFEAALAGDYRVAQVQSELEAVETSLGKEAVYANLRNLERALHAQQRLLEEYQALGGDSYSQRVRQTLLGLGLPQGDLDKPLRSLSGGQKKLVGLARVLLAHPRVLLLDEPDNHLDLAGKLYLEKLVREYPGAVVIISHDRYLLDACVTATAELEDGRLQTFTGSYSEYMLDKEIRMTRQEELYRVQQHQVARLEASIKRLAIWGKLYDNEKFSSRSKAMQKRLDKMEKIERPLLERRRMELQLAGWRGSNKVLEFKGVGKSFSGRRLLHNINQTIWHGERVGLIGPNGSGKSVLLRLALGLEQPDYGEILLGPSVKVGYYAQEHESLDPAQTLIEAVRYASSLSEASAVSFLIRYLFSYPQASQKIGELSGGERSRLQLALLVLSGANFLLLDEPTNNLDIASAEVLEAALFDFEGAVLTVSHDRYFLDRTVNRILVIETGELLAYPGGYSDYLEATTSR
jgi:ATP-binding cassette subfamily F protein 3